MARWSSNGFEEEVLYSLRCPEKDSWCFHNHPPYLCPGCEELHSHNEELGRSFVSWLSDATLN